MISAPEAVQSIPDPETAPTRRESVRLRYSTTLFGQIPQHLFAAVTASIVPRALGPVLYGNYVFLTNMASNIRNMFDFGTQQTFFNFSSKATRSGPLTKIFSVVLVVQLGLSLLLAFLAHFLHGLHWLWPGQVLQNVLLVTSLEWLIALSLLLRQLGDSKGLTVHTQAAAAALAIVNVAGLVGLALAHAVTFYSYIGLLYLTSLALCLWLSIYLLVTHKPLCWEGEIRPYIALHAKTWLRYATPLAVYGFYSALMGGIDTYLLQKLYGSRQQAYFGLSSRFSAVVLVFTSSAINIYWRELAHSYGTQNKGQTARIYVRFNRLLFFLSTFLAFWLYFSARKVALLLAGEQYLPAIPVIMIMAFYPVSQTYGQLNNVALLASERTKTARDLGIKMSLIGMVFSYLLLAPSNFVIPGMHLGAAGVAIKMTWYGILFVQYYEYKNCRFFGIGFWALFRKKALTAFTICLIALLAIRGLGYFLDLFHAPIVSNLAATTLFYFLLIIVALRFKPDLAGLCPSDVRLSVYVNAVRKRWRTLTEMSHNRGGE